MQAKQPFTFQNEWGNGRMLLIPYKDSQGRTYVFGASISIDELSTLLEEREKCMAAGMVAHITKPIDIDTLIAAI